MKANGTAGHLPFPLRQDEELPVPLGVTVWHVRENPACHYGVRDAEIFLFGTVRTPRWIVEPVPFTLELLDDLGKTVFLTEDEGTRHIMDAAENCSSAAGTKHF